MKRECHVRFCEGLGVKLPGATRLVICCKANAAEALEAMQQVMDRFGLTVNEEKTHVCRASEQYFDFLGYTFGRNR